MDRKKIFAGLFLLALLTALSVLSVTSCGVSKKSEPAPQPLPPPPPPGDDDDDDCGEVTFEQVQPVLADRFVGCHFAPARIDSFEVATDWADEIVRRINLSNGSDERMPPPPAQPLTPEQRETLERWVEDGKKEKCDSQAAQFIDLKSAETSMVRDALKLSDDERDQTIYLLTTDLINEGKSKDELEVVRQAMDKALNSLNVEDDALFRATKVAPGVWRIDLEDFGLEGNKIRVVELADPINIIPKTDEGVQLRDLLGTDKPYFHARNFIDVTHRNSDVYYFITEIPGTLAQYQDQLGIDIQEELADFNATFAGNADSPISIEKNRLITRFELDNPGGQDGYYWQTFDPIALEPGEEDRNLFAFPCLVGTCSKIFDFAASEVIVTNPNGMQIYSLWAANGQRQNAAPLNVVADNKPGPRGPEIVNAISCQKCHYAGIITMADQVLGKVTQPGSGLDAADVEIVKEFYKPAGALSATFTEDIRQFTATLAQIGVDATKPDPINVVNDEYLLSWNARKVAAFLFLKEADFIELLGQSVEGSAQAGQLLSGGAITYDQLIQVLPILIEDLRLFQEPLGD
jgi:hypothetical protein